MKLGNREYEPDVLDLRILEVLQEDCKTPLAIIGDKVGLSAASVIERIRKLEESGIIRGYAAMLDARLLGKDVTAFVGVSSMTSTVLESMERAIATIDDVLEIHHVTGAYAFILKVKTENTASLELLLRQVRAIDGVTHTETMIVLSTHTERWRLPLRTDGAPLPRRAHRPVNHVITSPRRTRESS